MGYDPEGNSLAFFLLAIVVTVGLVILSSCDSSPSVSDEPDLSLLQYGRHETLEEAFEEAFTIGQQHASEDEKEVGFFVFENQGGFYVSRLIGGILSQADSVKIDPSYLPEGVTIWADFHTHRAPNDNLIFNERELANIRNHSYPSYVVDCNGNVYRLSDTAESIDEVEKIR